MTPLRKSVTWPVLALTTIATQSEASEIAAPAECREPNPLGRPS